MSSAKFVLAVMADQTTSDLVFMAVETLAKATSQDRKTVIANIARLIEWGLLEDTGERRGKTGQIPVYRLLMGEGLFDVAPFAGKEPKSGTVPKTGPVPKADLNSTVFPSKDSQKRDTDLKLTQELDPSLSPAQTREDETELPTFDPAPEGVEPDSTPPTAAGAACLAMRRAGMVHTNPSDPRLLAALAAGVTETELADVVTEVLAKGGAPPGLAYVCITALNRRRDAAREPTHASTSQTRGNDRSAGRQSAADVAAERARRIFASGTAAGDAQPEGPDGAVAVHERGVSAQVDERPG
jgi:hypothetical protein